MPGPYSWSYRKFGPTASTIVLAKKGGAILGGIWVTAKGTTPKIIAYDASASTASAAMFPSYTPTALGQSGALDFSGGLGTGAGLTVVVASVSGMIAWQPRAGI